LALMEAYFDESGTQRGARALCVAGYMFEKSAAIELDEKWRAMLAKWGIDHYHTTDCVPDPGWGPFAGWKKEDRIQVSREAIELIKLYHTRGMAISVDLEYAHLIPRYGQFTSNYTFACWQALLAVRYWCRDQNYKGEIAYFFEAGHQSQAEANEIMDRIFTIPELRDQYRYSSHSFVQKKKVPLLQCADILAWHWCNQLQRDKRGEFRLRRDFGSLVEERHVVSNYDQERIAKWLGDVQRRRWIYALKVQLGMSTSHEQMLLCDFSPIYIFNHHFNLGFAMLRLVGTSRTKLTNYR
jgi:Protein of unknown function (DUF3800)